MTDFVTYINCIDTALHDIEKNIVHGKAMHAIKFIEQYCHNISSYLKALQNNMDRSNKDVPILVQSWFSRLFFQNDELAYAAMKSLKLPDEINLNADFIEIIEQVAQVIIDNHKSEEITRFLRSEDKRSIVYFVLAGIIFVGTFAILITCFTCLPSSTVLGAAVVLSILGGIIAAALPMTYTCLIKAKINLFECEKITYNIETYRNKHHKNFYYSIKECYEDKTQTLGSDSFFSKGTVRFDTIIHTHTDPTGILPNEDYQVGTNIIVSGVKKAGIVHTLRVSDMTLFKDRTNKSIADQVAEYVGTNHPNHQ